MDGTTGSLETRASDEERQLVIERLREETTAGRLTLDEFDERVGEVWTAKTRGELQHALRELPDPVPPAADEPASPDEPPGFEQKVRRRYRGAVRNDVAGFVSANAIFGTIWWVNGADGRFWPMWVLLPTTVGLLARLIRGPDRERRAVEEEWRAQQRKLGVDRSNEA